MCQLLITLACVATATYHIPTRDFLREYAYVYFIALFLGLGIVIVLGCSENARRKSPINFILLLAFTILESVAVAGYVTHFYPEQVMMGLGITVVLCFVLIIFALQTKIDFTVLTGILMIAVMILIIASLVGIFFQDRLFKLIIAAAGATLFSIYLIVDVQLLMDGKHKYSISPEEYILAALSIYLDIINIFIYILAIIGSSED